MWFKLTLIGGKVSRFLLLFDISLQDSPECINMTTRWFDGLINKDMDITKEVYSLRSVEFERQVC